MGYNLNSGYGQMLASALNTFVPSFGRIFVVFSTSDASEERYQRLQSMMTPDYWGQLRFYTDLATAYGDVTSNNNDVILLDGDSTHSLTSGLDIAKNRVNFIGMDGGGRLQQQGAKIQLATASTSAYVYKDTGVRNSYRNIKFIQAATAATALTVGQLGSEGAMYKNVSHCFGVANNLGLTTAHEVVAGTDTATFEDCTFGNDTLLTSAARSVFHIDQVNGFEFKSNYLRNCNFMISSSSSTATFVRLDAVGDILFSNTFDHCNFIASVDSAGGAAIANASQTGTGTVKGTLLYNQPAAFNVTDFAVATNGWNANTQVVSYVSAAASTEGKQPTA